MEKKKQVSRTSPKKSSPFSEELSHGLKLSEGIKPGSLSILRKKEKEKILFSLRKIAEDFNSMELFYSQFEMSAEDTLRSNQYIKNNKKRITTIIWTLTGSFMKS